MAWLRCMRQEDLIPIPNIEKLSVEESREEASRHFLTEVARTVAARRLIVTENGYLGLGAGNTNKGYLVCVLLGGPVPFILRRGSDDEFILVGEAYVHGAMHGEIMEKVQARELVQEEFKLR